MQSFQYGTTTIDYSVEYKKGKKDVTLSVCLAEGVKLVAPEGIDSEKLEGILYKKAPWILKKQNELDEVVAPPPPKEYISGEKFAYLGRHYRLKVHRSGQLTKTTLAFKNGRFWAEVPAPMPQAEAKLIAIIIKHTTFIYSSSSIFIFIPPIFFITLFNTINKNSFFL